MGRFLDDLNRLSATAAEGNVLLFNGGFPRSSFENESIRGANKPAASSSSRLCKTNLIPRHASSDFVSKHYEVVRELGRGSFSRVQLVRERRTGHERVCKVVSTEGMTKEVLELTRSEIQVLATLDHPSIVKLYEYAEDTSKRVLVLILEYIAGGDCSGLLQASGSLSEGRVASLIHQLLVATSYCHAKGIVHRDIKPQNMMLTRSVGAWGTPSLKVIDFGLAACAQKSRDFVGTPAYMPPEVLDGTVDYTSQADIWSIACTAVELLAGAPPFGTPEDHGGDMEPVFAGIRAYRDFTDVEERLEDLPSWGARSSEAKDFVARLLRSDPERRPTALAALGHPWIRRHTPRQSGLTADMVRSMADFATAPPLARCCLLVLAARTGISEQASLGSAFVDADANGDGSISREELVDAVARASVCGWTPEVDAGSAFASMDLLCNGALGYTEFAAACLWGGHGRNLDRLAAQAFCALDDDRDGLVQLVEVGPLFCTEALSELARLPRDRPFGPAEFRACVRAAAAAAVAAEAGPSRGPHEGASEGEDEDGPSGLMRFFRGFFCEQLACTACEQGRDMEDDPIWSGELPVVFHHNFDPNLEVPDHPEKPFSLRVV